MTRHLLAIETSCDETAAAVVTDDFKIVASTVASQVEEHARFGGVVPEVASRSHLEAMLATIDRTLAEAEMTGQDLAGVAVTRGPGLVGPLAVGVATAKALGLAWGVPVVGVNHLEGHLLSIMLCDEEPVYPCLCLLVSGGHCFLSRIRSVGHYELLGQTRDDSIGEVYDKVARFLGLGYPGGPVIDRMATGRSTSLRFPRPMLNEGLDFSFSGLKTGVVNYVTAHPDVANEDVATAFVEACMEVLLVKMARGLEAGVDRAIAVVGGVAASPILRREAGKLAEEAGCRLLVPKQRYATDNAAMIGVAGWQLLEHRGADPADFGPDPNLTIEWTAA